MDKDQCFRLFGSGRNICTTYEHVTYTVYSILAERRVVFSYTLINELEFIQITTTYILHLYRVSCSVLFKSVIYSYDSKPTDSRSDRCPQERDDPLESGSRQFRRSDRHSRGIYDYELCDAIARRLDSSRCEYSS